MGLKETAKLMVSENYRERFLSEYWQTKIRYERLKDLNTKIEAQTLRRDLSILSFKPSAPAELLREQQRAMGQYLHILEVRAAIEGIGIENELIEHEE